jgi:hypothetical protein
MNRTGVALGVIGVILSGITIFGIYRGPINVLKIRGESDAKREGRNRKLNISKTGFLISARH